MEKRRAIFSCSLLAAVLICAGFWSDANAEKVSRQPEGEQVLQHAVLIGRPAATATEIKKKKVAKKISNSNSEDSRVMPIRLSLAVDKY